MPAWARQNLSSRGKAVAHCPPPQSRDDVRRLEGRRLAPLRDLERVSLVARRLARLRRADVREAVRRDAQGRTAQLPDLRNYAWVARRFPPSRRRDILSFQHYPEAALSEAAQELRLHRAERMRWA